MLSGWAIVEIINHNYYDWYSNHNYLMQLFVDFETLYIFFPTTKTQLENLQNLNGKNWKMIYSFILFHLSEVSSQGQLLKQGSLNFPFPGRIVQQQCRHRTQSTWTQCSPPRPAGTWAKFCRRWKLKLFLCILRPSVVSPSMGFSFTC